MISYVRVERCTLGYILMHFLIIYLFACTVCSVYCKAEIQLVCGSLWF